MRSLNKVFLMGNLGADVDLRYSKDGKPRALFSVATGRMRKKDDGEWAEETEWHRVVTFNTLAERCSTYLRKGSAVLVEGRSQRRSWEDPERGRQWMHEVIAYDVVFLRTGNDREARSDRARPDADGASSSPPPVQEADADLPF